MDRLPWFTRGHLPGANGKSGILGKVGLMFALGLMTASPGAAWAENCSLGRFAELPIVDDSNPIVSLLIDNQPRKVLIDTGGFWSMMSDTLAANYKSRVAEIEARLGLVGLPMTKAVNVPSVQLGQAVVKHVDFFVAPPGYLDSIDATLGANWLKQFDVEIDPVEKKINFFSKDHCEGKVVYWPHSDLAVIPVDFDREQGHLTIPIKLNGEELEALIDTGAPASTISARRAEKLFGLKSDSPGVQRLDYNPDADGKPSTAFRYQFKTMDLGELASQNPWLIVAPMKGAGPDLILGMHELRNLHLYFAYNERKLYMTTARGDIAAHQTAGGATDAVPMHAPDPLNRTNAKDSVETARLALGKNDYAVASANLEKAIQLDPTYAPIYEMRAILHEAKKERELAFQDFAEAIRRDPDFAVAYTERARLYAASNDRVHAMQDLTDAIRIDPRYVGAYVLRASLFALTTDHEQALQDLANALKIEPKSAAIYAERGQIFGLWGDYNQAYDNYDQAVELEPKSAALLNNRCWTGAILGRLKSAMDDCNDALELAPKSAAALDSRGFVNLRSGRLDKAIDDYTAALTEAPKQPSSLYGRGLAKRQKGDSAQGDADIAAAQAIDPDIAQHFGK